MVAAEALLYDRLDDPDKPVLAADSGEQLAGLALPAFHQAPRGWYATLDDLAVRADVRRRGAGRVLVAAAAALAQARGCTRLHAAFTGEASGLREFLVACGFSADGTLSLPVG